METLELEISSSATSRTSDIYNPVPVSLRSTLFWPVTTGGVVADLLVGDVAVVVFSKMFATHFLSWLYGRG